MAILPVLLSVVRHLRIGTAEETWHLAVTEEVASFDARWSAAFAASEPLEIEIMASDQLNIRKVRSTLELWLGTRCSRSRTLISVWFASAAPEARPPDVVGRLVRGPHRQRRSSRGSRPEKVLVLGAARWWCVFCGN